MKINCVVCGKEFEAKTVRAKYCSKVCSNHSRFIKTAEERKEISDFLKNATIKLYDSEKSTREIAELTGRSCKWVRDVWRDAGLPRRLTQQQLSIIEMRKKGYCCVEISRELKLDRKYIKVTAKKLGYPFTEEEVKRSIELKKSNIHIDRKARVARCKEYIDKYHPQWEYVSGFIGIDKGEILLRCKKCGKIISKAPSTVRQKGTLLCPICKEKEHIINKKKKILETHLRKQEKIKQKEEKFWKQPFNQMAVSFCQYCNKVFIGNGKYCCEDCRKKATNAYRKDKRLSLIKDRLIDKDIEIHKLYKRDNGICWLCNKKCDFQDFQTDKNGNFIAGENYPSIDHVKPLSKGGLHSWDNVRLAHFYCNTLKSNKVVNV